MNTIDLVVPDLGNFQEVSVVDVLVKPGDTIEVESPLITLETDKASMDVPSTHAGKITEVLLKRGDQISKGTVIAKLQATEAQGAGGDTVVMPVSPADAARVQAIADRAEGAATSNADAASSGRESGPENKEFSSARAGEASGATSSTPRPDASAGGASAANDSRFPATTERGGLSSASSDAAAGRAGAASNSSAGASSRARPDVAASGSPSARAEAAAQAGSSVASGAGAGAGSAASSSTARPDVQAGRATQLLVLGAGPGGYTAAFRAADLGMRVTLVERWSALGGVCLNVGCIPSKALLHAAKVIEEAEAMSAHGISFGEPSIDLSRLRAWKGSVVKKLTGGLRLLCKQRKVEVVQGVGKFVSPHVVEVTAENGASERIRFDQCIIAAGSESVKLPGWPSDPRIMDSSEALELPEFDGNLLVVGGGIIGLEMACVYDALGSKVSVVELTPGLMPGCDPDLVRPLEKRIRARYEQVLVGTKVVSVEPIAEGIRVTFEGAKAPAPQVFGRVLVAVGRSPNGKLIGADTAGVTVNERGFIPVDKQMRTNVPHIFAIGDIVGQPMLAHKASHEAKVAAEVAAGHKSAFDARVIPSVAYTDPEIAWAGLTETEAQAKQIPFKKGMFPWVASGRSLSLGRDDGFTKLLFDPETRRVLGGGIVGPQAGDLISEVALAIEMGADAADIGLTVHPHPTLSETVAFAAEAFEGTLTDLYIPKK